MASKQAILKYLSKGKTLTTKQARSMFKIKNVAARIYDLRGDGVDIKTSLRKLTDGRMVKSYHIG